MKEIRTLRILLVFIILLACVTACIDYPINSEIMTFYFGGKRINGKMVAACLAIILGFLPKLIGGFYSKKETLKYGRLTTAIAVALFSLVLFAQTEAGYGLFTIILILILFSLNTIVSLNYHALKVKYAPQINEYLLKKLLRKLTHKSFLNEKTLDKVSGLARKEAVKSLTQDTEDAKTDMAAAAKNEKALKREQDRIIEQLNVLLENIDDDIDNAYSAYGS